MPGFCLQGDTARFVIRFRYLGVALTSVYLRCLVFSPYGSTQAFDSDRDLPFDERTSQLRRKDIKPGEMSDVVLSWTVPDSIPCGVYYTRFELWSPSKVTAPDNWLFPPIPLARSRTFGRPEIIMPIHKKVFVSYARDNENHCKWVLEFVECLRRFGIQVVMDKNPDYLMPGDRLREKLLCERDSFDFIIPICSIWYSKKADAPETCESKKSGVRIETEVFSETSFFSGSREKFLPIARDNQDLKGIDKLPCYLRELEFFYEDMDKGDWQGEPLTNVIRRIRKSA